MKKAEAGLESLMGLSIQKSKGEEITQDVASLLLTFHADLKTLSEIVECCKGLKKKP